MAMRNPEMSDAGKNMYTILKLGCVKKGIPYIFLIKKSKSKF